MNVDPITSRLAASGVAFSTAITAAARRHAVDPELLAAVAAQETGGPDSNSGRNVIGDGGHGHGLFQIDDRWHPFAQTADAMNPDRNADYAAGMLAGLLKQYGGNVREALSAYNAGSPTATGTTTKWADGQTLGYADSVLRHYARLDGGQDRAGALAATSGGELSAAVAGSTSPTHGPPESAPREQLSLPAFEPAPPESRSPLYHRQATDYLSFFDDVTDEQDS